MRTIFVTHKHIDHLLGIIWMMRMICQHMREGTYEGEATIYAHDEVIALLRDLAGKLLQKKELPFLDSRLHLIAVADGEENRCCKHTELILICRFYTDYSTGTEHIWSDI